MLVSVLLPAVSSSRLVALAGVYRYQTFGHEDVYGSSAARVAPLTSSVSVNGSAVTTVALSKSSFGGTAASAGADWTKSNANATSAPRSSVFMNVPYLYDLSESVAAARYHLKRQIAAAGQAVPNRAEAARAPLANAC